MEARLPPRCPSSRFPLALFPPLVRAGHRRWATLTRQLAAAGWIEPAALGALPSRIEGIYPPSGESRPLRSENGDGWLLSRTCIGPSRWFAGSLPEGIGLVIPRLLEDTEETGTWTNLGAATPGRSQAFNEVSRRL